jgi:hypothetical protein
VGHHGETFSADSRLGGDYGTALCAAVANRRYSTVRFLVKKVDLRLSVCG